MRAPTIVWFRHDLRLADNPALSEAAARGPVLPLYVLEDGGAPGRWAPGGAARWWLGRSLAALAADLAARGAPLLLARGAAETVVPALADAAGARVVRAGRQHSGWARGRDGRTGEALAASGAALCLHDQNALHPPGSVLSGTGKPYAVFKPFGAKVLADPPGEPLPAPDRLEGAPHPAGGEALADWGLAPSAPDWSGGMAAHWEPGEAGGHRRLARFLERPAGEYATARDLPGVEGSSALSPHLHWGELSPRQVWRAVADAGGAAAEPYLRELAWRDFSRHLLWHRPELPDRALRPEFAAFPWEPDAALLRAWQRGRTGYPIVDAGMRQLWRIGWMHNRVRMITASLLVKHLLQPWQAGAAWFWDALVDADLANNSTNWQWVAGSGTDAAPYFRVFNPVAQGERHDPDGTYVRAWVPELARLPDRWIHRPWEAPEAALRAAGVTLGETYPRPVVDHAAGRARALAAFAAMRGAGAGGDGAGEDGEAGG